MGRKHTHTHSDQQQYEYHHFLEPSSSQVFVNGGWVGVYVLLLVRICCCCCCCLHIKSRSVLYSVLSNIRTGPTDCVLEEKCVYVLLLVRTCVSKKKSERIYSSRPSEHPPVRGGGCSEHPSVRGGKCQNVGLIDLCALSAYCPRI